MDAEAANVMAQWFDLCHRCGVGLADATVAGEEIHAAYTEPHRHYHTLDHVRACLRNVDEVPLDDATRTTVELALWFHDVVYDPTAPDNEHRSAEWARRWIRAHVDDADTLAREVAGLIEMTAGHELTPDASPAARVVHDIDLAVLGSAPEVYDEYADHVRAEYAHISDGDYRDGRRLVLSAMLAADPIYVLPGFRDRLEARARSNMQRELERLSG